MGGGGLRGTQILGVPVVKVAILAGGLGTRLQERTVDVPKPMIQIGGHPILWHIMRIFAHHGFEQFVIALGYKKEVINSYFLNFVAYADRLSIRPGEGYQVQAAQPESQWLVDLLDTGLHTETGGRLQRVAEFIGDETFILTYGDGVSNVNIPDLVRFHKNHGRLATVTAVRPPARFGHLTMDNARVARFGEKQQMDEGWINGGFFVLEPGVAKYLHGDETVFEQEPLENLAKDGQLMAYRHDGFWACMDTLRDVNRLDALWNSGAAPWMQW